MWYCVVQLSISQEIVFCLWRFDFNWSFCRVVLSRVPVSFHEQIKFLCVTKNHCSFVGWNTNIFKSRGFTLCLCRKQHRHKFCYFNMVQNLLCVHYWLILLSLMSACLYHSVNGGGTGVVGSTGYFQWRRVATKLGIE